MNYRILVALAVPVVALLGLAAQGQDVDPQVLAAEKQRIAAIEKVRPSVVAVFSRGGQGGGSGVIIDKEGYALTNYHVVQGSGPVMKCGLADGVLYDAVLVGLDKVGDIALIKLLPKEKGKDFPFSVMADSDKVRAGDWSMAMGNPFLLATDFTPTVTFGLVSGVHRYQYPSGLLLEYGDCIQIDTSINPGNSGGPLYNLQGELIGINGRGSFEKRGRVNSGVGYAISINQVKNFLGHLKAGIDTDHATLGATVASRGEDEGDIGQLIVQSVLENTDVARRGLESGDELVSFAGRPLGSVNEFKNILSIFPKGWRMPLVYRRDNAKHEALVRLMKLRREEAAQPPRGGGRPAPQLPNTPAAKLYDPRPGYANYHFNKYERDQLLANFKKHGDFSSLLGTWTLEGEAALKGKTVPFKLVIGEEAEGKPIVRAWTYHLNPRTLPSLPDPGDEESDLRKAARKADEALRKYAEALPQEIWAKDTPAGTKAEANALLAKADTAQKELDAARKSLEEAGKARDKESRLWQANYDYTLARITSYCAYVNEYRHLLKELASDKPPERDAKKHRGWRMVSQSKVESGDEATKLAAAAKTIYQKMLADYKGTIWEDRAKEGAGIEAGLNWQPSGGTHTIVRLTMNTEYNPLDPLKLGQTVQDLMDPPGSGGLMSALYQYRRLLTRGPSGFEGGCHHGGHEPIYPPPKAGVKPKSVSELRVDTAVLHTDHAAVPVQWHFDLKDQKLIGFEAWITPNADPCEVYASDYREVDGRLFPHRLEVVNGDNVYATITLKSIQLK
ncbi:MAG: S1C family serine protease [Gemmataceae bacterium]